MIKKNSSGVNSLTEKRDFRTQQPGNKEDIIGQWPRDTANSCANDSPYGVLHGVNWQESIS